MDKIRGCLGFSFSEIETLLLARLRELLAEGLETMLQRLDDSLFTMRDSERFKVKKHEERTVETAIGQSVRFRRRQYFDCKKNKYVFLLDEALSLEPYKQISPLLAETLLEMAVNTSAYRKAADSLEAIQGHRVVSHETVRQRVLEAGERLQDAQDAELADPCGKRRVPVLFLEVDGLWVHLQQQQRKSTEEKMLTVHEGWQPRYSEGKSGGYELLEKRQYRSQSGQSEGFWEKASRFVYSHYDIDDDTVVVINGDRANWIRKGTEYFPKALYQIDRFHLKRDILRLFRAHSQELSEIMGALEDEEDLTGGAFLARLEQGLKKLGGKGRRECEALLKDLTSMPEATVDYRHRLAAQGVDTTNMRGLGAAESQADGFADRVKGRGRSWSPTGLSAMMELLCWWKTDRLHEVTARLRDWLRSVDEKLDLGSSLALEAVNDVLAAVAGGTSTLAASVPIAGYGKTGSGGMSCLMNRIVGGGLASVAS
jgi:hypothetical protein